VSPYYFSSTVLPSGRSRIVQVEKFSFPPHAPVEVRAKPFSLSVRVSGARGRGRVEVWGISRAQLKNEIARAEGGAHVGLGVDCRCGEEAVFRASTLETCRTTARARGWYVDLETGTAKCPRPGCATRQKSAIVVIEADEAGYKIVHASKA